MEVNIKEKNEDKAELALLVKSLNYNTFQIKDTIRLEQLFENTTNDTIKSFANSLKMYFKSLNFLEPAFLKSFHIEYDDLYSCNTENLRDSIPFILKGSPIIKVKINDKFFSLILDTGSPNTVLSKEAFDQLHVQKIKNTVLPIANFKSSIVKSWNGLLPAITFDKISIKNIPIHIVDDDKYYEAMDVLKDSTLEISGILGWDILKRLNIRLDYKDNFLVINQKHLAKSYNRKVFGVIRPHVVVTLLNGVKTMLNVDTGALFTIFNQSHFEDELESLNSYKLPFTSLSGIIIDTVYQKEYLFYLDDYKYNFPRLLISKRACNPMNSAGSIGNDVFILGGFILDWEAGHFKNYVYKGEKRYILSH